MWLVSAEAPRESSGGFDVLALGERALDASLLKGRAPGHGESGASSPFL